MRILDIFHGVRKLLLFNDARLLRSPMTSGRFSQPFGDLMSRISEGDRDDSDMFVHHC